jgi:hypothetical protein
MEMSERGFAIHIERIDLAAIPPGGERRLRDAIARELSHYAERPAEPARAAQGDSGKGPAALAHRVRAAVAREAGRNGQ